MTFSPYYSLPLLYYSEYLSLKHKEDSYIDWYITVSNECMIELKESFKLGFKEAYIYFESMDMLKI